MDINEEDYLRLLEENKKLKSKQEKQYQSIRKWQANNKDKVTGYIIKSVSQNPKKYILNRTKQNAKTRGIEFSITEDDFEIPNFCPLLNIRLELNIGQGKKKRHNSPSLDRIDSSKGYIKGNVWVISDRANRMKNDATMDELIMFSKNVLKIFVK